MKIYRGAEVSFGTNQDHNLGRNGIVFYKRTFVPLCNPWRDVSCERRRNRPSWWGILGYGHHWTSGLAQDPELGGPVYNTIEDEGMLEYFAFGKEDGQFTAENLLSPGDKAPKADAALLALSFYRDSTALSESIKQKQQNGYTCHLLSGEKNGYPNSLSNDSPGGLYSVISLLELLPGKYEFVMQKSQYDNKPMLLEIRVREDCLVTCKTSNRYAWEQRERESAKELKVAQHRSPSENAVFF